MEAGIKVFYPKFSGLSVQGNKTIFCAVLLLRGNQQPNKSFNVTILIYSKYSNTKILISFALYASNIISSKTGLRLRPDLNVPVFFR